MNEFVNLPGEDEDLPAHLDLFDDAHVRDLAMKGWKHPDLLPTYIMSLAAWKVLTEYYVNN
jgi:hypothetical protein